MSAIPSHPTTPHQQATNALHAFTQQQSIGLKAAADACGKEFQPPKDLIGAAQIIRHLRSQRDTAQHEIEGAFRQGAANTRDAIAKIQEIADKKIASLNAQLAATQKAADEARRNYRDFLVDRSLTELPTLPGYFVGATPMQRAAESGAVLIGMLDKIARPMFVDLMRSNYLRSRGWKLGVNNSWISAAGLSLPADNAVQKQVRIDTAPFMVFAKGMMGKSSAEAMEDGQQFVAMTEAPETFDGVYPVDVKADDAKTACATALVAPHGEDELEKLPMTASQELAILESAASITLPIGTTEAAGPIYVGTDGTAPTNIREEPTGSGRIVGDVDGVTRVIADPFPALDTEYVADTALTVETHIADPSPVTPEPLIAGQLKNKAHVPKPKPGQVAPTPRYSGQVVSKPPRNTAETFTMPRLR